MSIKLVVEGKPPIELDGEEIFLGSDPSCTVAFCDALNVKPHHAVIRLVDERWLIEVLQADSVIVGGTKPKKAHWLTPGDLIFLTDDGPKFSFDPPIAVPPPSKQKSPKMSDVIMLPESDDVIPPLAPDPKLKSSTEVPVKSPQSSTNVSSPKSAALKTVKPSSSAIIQIPKKASSTSVEQTKPPGSKTMKSTDPPSTATMKTTTASGVAIPNKKSSDRIPRPASSSDAITRRSSTEIKVPKSEPREPEAKMPVLKRITSYEMPIPPELSEGEAVDDWEGGGRRRRKGNDADMDFIKTVVIWSVSIGIGILILYIGIRELVNATSAPKTGSVSTSFVAPSSLNINLANVTDRVIVETRNLESSSDPSTEQNKKRRRHDLFALTTSMGAIMTSV